MNSAGAQIGLLDIDHPDIQKFISFKAIPNSRNERLLDEYDRNLKYFNSKLKNTKYYDVLKKTLLDDQLTHFNILVNITDDFMEAVKNDLDWELKSRVGEESKFVRARDLLEQIASQSWESGDPGVLFEDRINEDNMVPFMGKINATNPCVTGDTKILTVYDGPVAIKDLAEKGEDVLVYCWNPDTKLPEVSTMRNPRKTRENSELVEVVFDSGLRVKCTPDHNFRTFRGNKIEAKDLKVGQAIRAFSMSLHKDGHIRVHGWVNGKSKHQYIARMIWEYANGQIEPGKILHHMDYNPLNNKLDNLQLVESNSEHNRIHYPERHRKGFFKPKNHKVIEVNFLEEREDVYNGTVDGCHTYIISDPVPVYGLASGIVSCNCGKYFASI